VVVVVVEVEVEVEVVTVVEVREKAEVAKVARRGEDRRLVPARRFRGFRGAVGLSLLTSGAEGSPQAFRCSAEEPVMTPQPIACVFRRDGRFLTALSLHQPVLEPLRQRHRQPPRQHLHVRRPQQVPVWSHERSEAVGASVW